MCRARAARGAQGQTWNGSARRADARCAASGPVVAHRRSSGQPGSRCGHPAHRGPGARAPIRRTQPASRRVRRADRRLPAARGPCDQPRTGPVAGFEVLQVTVAQVRVAAVSTGTSPKEGVTAGSLSVQDSGLALRQACAQARDLLLAAATTRLVVDHEPLNVVDGQIRAATGPTGLSYWTLAQPHLRCAGGARAAAASQLGADAIDGAAAISSPATPSSASPTQCWPTAALRLLGAGLDFDLRLKVIVCASSRALAAHLACVLTDQVGCF